MNSSDPTSPNETGAAPAAPPDELGRREPTLVVGIGASAGGLEALEQFFEAMPADSGMAFVVVQHLSPDFRSLMDELLAPRTTMAIRQVEDGMAVEADTVHLLPPRKEMIVEHGRLRLFDKEPAPTLSLPIDRFFRSLAEDQGPRAVGIVLSGTGSDGSRGVVEIRDRGGLVVVQDEESAKFDGMPRSAIATGAADLVLPPREMPAALLERSSADRDAAGGGPDKADEPGSARLLRSLREVHGIDFSHYKPTTVGRRIERRMQMAHDADLEAYADRAARDPGELDALFKDLLIGVTRFFRDREAFARLEESILPDLVERADPTAGLRVWVAGCGTGEEAYSLAILLREALDRRTDPPEVRIFATDVHQASIDVAGAGVYSEDCLAEVGPERQERFFVRHGSGWKVADELRRMVVFARHNVLRDAPFRGMDLVSCRNLLIYLQPEAQRRVLSLFHFALREGGVLFLGPSESSSELEQAFETVDAHWKIHRRRRETPLLGDVRPLPAFDATRPRVARTPSAGARSASRLERPFASLLDEFLPPSLLVDERFELLHTFAGGERHLRVRAGRTSVKVLDLVEGDLRIALAGALGRAAKTSAPASFKGIRTAAGSDLRLSVRPVRAEPNDPRLFLVSLEQEEGSRPAGPGEAAEYDADEGSRDRVRALESELRLVRENLQATVEELETSNEELQAANEELLASNEELQTTNEELHSANEELYTVNAEYHRKIDELTRLNDDVDHLLRSTEVGTVFLDRDLCIRKFTPQIGRTFHLVERDVGRRIDVFAHDLDHPGLQDDIATVLRTGERIDREVRDRAGRWYLLRILPFRPSTRGEDGVLLTLVDVTDLRRVQSELAEVGRRLQGLLDHSTTFVSVKDLAGRYELCNRAAESFLGVSPATARGRTDHDFLPSAAADAIGAHDREVAGNGRAMEFEETLPGPDGDRTFLTVRFPLRDDAGRIVAVGAVATDITDRKRQEEEQRLAVVRRDRFLAMLSHELRTPLGAVAGAAAVLERRPDAPTVANMRGVIAQQARQMIRLVDDLLDVSRYTRGAIEIRRVPLDLRTVVGESCDAVRPRLAERGQRLEVALPEVPVPVSGDAARLQQVLGNLLTNACKFSPEGSRVRVATSVADGYAEVRVADDGEGIPSDMLERIFELFVQAENARRTSEVGIGVGLALARSLVELHGGTLTVRSEGPGRGSEFLVRLPLAVERLPDPGPPVAEAPGQRLRILLVEDREAARETLATLLRLEGFDVATASDGREALELAAVDPPDVALVDVGLPDVDGREVARRLRSEPRYDSLLLIALTGFGSDRDRAACREAGFDEHLVKPLDLDRFRGILGRARSVGTRSVEAAARTGRCADEPAS